MDLLVVQKTLKSLLQHHSSKLSILRHSAFFIVHLSHPYIAIGKTVVLTKRTFVGKVMSLLFNMLSRLVIDFLPRSKCLLIFMTAVTICRDFGAQGNKVCHCFHSSQEHNFGECLGPGTYSVGRVLKTHSCTIIKVSLVVQTVKNLPIMWET